MENANYSFNKLTPTNECDISAYKEAFDFIFINDDLRNVAITGPYSAGKSSVLESYKKQHSDPKYMHISLAHFETSESEEKENIIEELGEHKTPVLNVDTKLEGKILNQLIHQIDPEKIPGTHFKVKTTMPKGKQWKYAGMGIGLIVLLLYIINFKSYSLSFSILPDKSLIKFLLDFTVWKESQFAAFIGLLILLLFILKIFVKAQYENGIVKKISIQGSDIEIFASSNESFFDKYLNEVLYVFEHAGADIFVFEDLDRYDNNQIFKKLRDINYLLNKKLELKKKEKNSIEVDIRVIRFFYLLRDDVFTTKDRTKFFDFIIPIVPVIDGSNSLDKLNVFFNDCKEFESQREKEFLQGLSLYIDDLRILKNIHNEYQIYNKRLSSIELDSCKLLALMTYKNIFPKDFTDMQIGQGYVYSLIAGKDKLQGMQLEALKKKLAEEENLLKKIQNEYLNEIDELDAIFFTFSTGNQHISISGQSVENCGTRLQLIKSIKANSGNVYNNSYQNTFNVTPALNKLNERADYSERKKIIELKASGEKEVMQKRIAMLKKEIKQIRGKKLSDLFSDNIKDKDLFIFKGETETGVPIDFSKLIDNPYFDLIKYLIRNGYIDETYSDYMTYFYGNTLTTEDKNYLRSVADAKPKNVEYKLRNKALVASRLREADYSKVEALNYDLFDYLISTEQEHLLMLIYEALIKTTNVEFIMGYTEVSSKPKMFFWFHNKKWPEFWDIFSTKETFTNSVKNEFLVSTMEYSDEEDIERMNEMLCISNYLRRSSDFLSTPMQNIEKVVDGLDLLQIKFDHLEFENVDEQLIELIYNKELYRINKHNIEIIFIEKYKVTKGSNYMSHACSIVYADENEAFSNYVLKEEYVNTFIGVIIENSRDEINDTETIAIMVLNNDHIKIEFRYEYIIGMTSLISNISDIKETKLWSALLSANKVEYTGMNVLHIFMMEDAFSQQLINYINNHEGQINFEEQDVKDIYDDVELFYAELITCEAINEDKYRMLLGPSGRLYDEFPVEGVSAGRMAILIELGLIQMTAMNLIMCREKYSALVEDFIVKYISEYISIINTEEETIVQDELLLALSCNRIDDTSKIALIKATEIEISVFEVECSDKVKVTIIENNFDINDLKRLLECYDTETDELKQSIIKRAAENKEIILDERIELSYEALLSFVKEASLTMEQKETLMIGNLFDFDEKQAHFILGEAMLVEYQGLLSRKKGRFNITNSSKMMLEMFVDKKWIRKYDIDAEDSTKYVAHGRDWV